MPFKPYPKPKPKPKGKKNKYNAVRQTYNGRSYDSREEANFAAELDWKIKAKEVVSWTCQHKFVLRCNGMHIRNYFIDFRVVLPCGTIEYIEYKGAEIEVWRIKWELTQANFEELTKGENARLVLVKKGYRKVFKEVYQKD